MKNFLKKNLWCIILIAVGILLMFLGTITAYCVLVACVIFGFLCIYYAVILRKKYKDIEDNPPDQNDYIDATQLDYDEDVYFVGEKDKTRKKVGKNIFSKISLNAPSIGLFLLGFGFFSISILSFLKSILNF